MGENSVHARLDYWIWSQNCTKSDGIMAGGDELTEDSNPLHLVATFGETRIYALEAELEMDASKTVKE